ncbi:MAG: pilus assembly protein PilM [Planctomycetes bacterium]|nr:pilus assembly protein PilM [Planctomycetota bacterium]
MLSLNAVAIQEGESATRVVWLKGSAGKLSVEKAIVVADGDRSLRALIARLKSEKVPVGGVTLGLGGTAASLRYNLVPPVPDWRLELIMKYEAEEMVQKSGEALSCDWRQLDVPESASDDLVLLVGLGKDNLVQPRIDDVEAAGGRVSAVTPHAIGLYHAYRQSVEGIPRENVVLADLGARESHIVIVADGRLLFARTVTFGGSQIDAMLGSSLDLPEPKARQLKEKLGTGQLPDHLEASTQPVLRSAFGQLNSMLGSSVTFCKAQTKIPDLPIDRALLCGGTSNLPGLTEYLERELGYPVEVFAPKTSGGSLPGAPQEWNVVIGLAASGLDPKSTLDLLSAPAKAKREFRERTRYLYAAAGVLVVALLIKFAAGFVANSATNALDDQLGEHKTQVSSWKNEFESAQRKNTKVKAQLDRVAREVLDTAFPARIQDALRRITPASIAIDSIETRREESDGQVYLEMEIRGTSDNSDRRGIDRVSELEESLQRIPGVAVVRPDVESPSEGVRSFRILVSPDANRPEKRSGGTRRAPLRRQP